MKNITPRSQAFKAASQNQQQPYTANDMAPVQASPSPLSENRGGPNQAPACEILYDLARFMALAG
jgi:hypothetical protein